MLGLFIGGGRHQDEGFILDHVTFLLKNSHIVPSCYLNEFRLFNMDYKFFHDFSLRGFITPKLFLANHSEIFAFP